MGEVSITINGRRFDIACDDGQEQNLIRLGEFVDGRVSELAATVGQVGNMRLLVLASLMIADELHDATAALKAATAAQEAAIIAREAAIVAREAEDAPATEDPPGAPAHIDENALATALENLCERVKSIAARLETP